MNVSARNRARDWARSLLRPTGPLPRPTRRNLAFDAALALVLGLGAVEYATGYGEDVPSEGGPPELPPLPMDYPEPAPMEHGGWPGPVALAVLAAAPLALRRRYPLAVLWIVTGAAYLTPDAGARLTFYALVVAGFTAAAYSPYRAPALASVLAASMVPDSVGPLVDNDYLTPLILVPIVVMANGLHTWQLRASESQARMSALARERAEELRRAAEQERARIARELHDVVSHNVSVIVIQAGAARTVMATAPEQAAEALLAVEAGGRAAMAELRHVMGLLTMDSNGPDAADTADLAPQPGLDQLSALVGRVRGTGVRVELTVTGEARALPQGVELAAYRVVQEALTNTVKHASGASATVTVAYGGDQLRVEVTDTGGPPGAGAATGNGRGLMGLRERLAVYGGTLHAGRRLGGGYRVRALIPVEAP
ncbi:sensor histidine kinase [Streptomyces litchfieldiae]|uniref:histidine kinase n=1 Tax=Streptomyces litchfieldiae TaxID=3075543 RepID=A0ABU2MXA6_9ACTN|nr:histidine kinase [Streptomyces sp. DSM 44938]MDT0345913.1 histidine kinase [Streptomyces sp. DSM 44938]